MPEEDLREAIVAAINQRGSALSTFIDYHTRSSSEFGRDEEDDRGRGGRGGRAGGAITVEVSMSVAGRGGA